MSTQIQSQLRICQSPAEKAREAKLREDPLATVLSPTYVECKRCGKRIKLSAKSAFDPLHWRTHRTRCLKTHPKTMRNTKVKAQMPASPLPLTSPHTPPFVHDNVDSVGSTEPSSSPLSFDASVLPPVCKPDVAAGGCLQSPNLVHPIHTTSPKNWQSWAWNRLKSPTIDFTVVHELEMKSADPNPDETMEQRMHREAALSLSLLSRSP